MNVLFVEPAFPASQREFVRALAQSGARVTGIGERALEHMDPELKSWMHAYEQITSVVNEDALLHAVRRCQRREWVDRLEATVEAHVLPAAKVREACGIPGTSVRTAFLCRDKPAMKEALREAGVPCAQSAGVTSPDEARAFVEKEGYPVVLKPRDSAGAAGTYHIRDAAELERAIEESGLAHGAPAAMEEFIEGHEGFYDTVTVNGEVLHEFISHYFPQVLEAMRTRWISPQFLTTNRLDTPAYDEVRRLGLKVIQALGIGTSATHMEWFFGPKGLKFSEIGCRPAGVDTWDVYCAANEMDLYREWALAIQGRPAAQQPSRRYAAGHVALRPTQDGQIAGYRGLEELERNFGEWIFAKHLPAAGSSTQPVEAGYKANAWIRMRHPDYDRLREMLNTVGQQLEVIAR